MNKLKWSVLGALMVIVAAGAFLAGRARAAGIPASGTLNYSGLLTDVNGAPLKDATKNIEIILWDSLTQGMGKNLCDTRAPAAPLSGGRFTVALDSACTVQIRNNSLIGAEIFVDGSSLGRTQLGAVPYAVEADEASKAAVGSALDTRIAALETRLGSVSAFRVSRTSGNVTIPDTTMTLVTFDTIDYDLASEIQSDKSTFIPTKGGYYLLTCSALFEGTPSIQGYLRGEVAVNGIQSQILSGFVGSLSTAARSATGVLLLKAGDKVTCQADQQTGGASQIVRNASWFEGTRLPL